MNEKEGRKREKRNVSHVSEIASFWLLLLCVVLFRSVEIDKSGPGSAVTISCWLNQPLSLSVTVFRQGCLPLVVAQG